MNQAAAETNRLVRFGAFELDLRSGELRKAGSRLTLQHQPLHLLSVLLERPGELVTREELRSRLWPEDTFVDFEHGLNAAVKRLRDTLGDSADTPRYVETLPRRGYRFIAPATAVWPVWSPDGRYLLLTSRRMPHYSSRMAGGGYEQPCACRQADSRRRGHHAVPRSTVALGRAEPHLLFSRARWRQLGPLGGRHLAGHRAGHRVEAPHHRSRPAGLPFSRRSHPAAGVREPDPHHQRLERAGRGEQRARPRGPGTCDRHGVAPDGAIRVR